MSSAAPQVTAVGLGLMDIPFFYGQEPPERLAYHKPQAMNGGLTKIENMVPAIKSSH